MKMTNKAIKSLASLRFTLLLISLLGVMFLLGLWIPQKSIVPWPLYSQWKLHHPALVGVFEALEFTAIYTSPLMLALWAFFFVNLSLVMWQRLPLLKKRIALPEIRQYDPSTAPGYPFHATFNLPGDMSGEEVIAFLRARRYSIIGDGDGFYGVKNRLSPLAFWLFHLSFFLIMLGGVASVYTKFAGVLELAQGEPFQGKLEQYVPTPQMPKIGAPPNAAFTVTSIVPQLTNGMPTGLRVRLVDDRGETHEADVNRP
jgi:cytochrome c biogenesis protein ResB